MRCMLMVGIALALVGVCGSSAAWGQFASDRKAPPSVPAATPGSPQPPASPALPPGVPGLGSRPNSPVLGTPGGVRPTGGFTLPPPSGVQPTGYATPQPQRASPAIPDVSMPSVLPADHPWLLKPDSGEYFIVVKSYSRPNRPDPGDPGKSSRELAEALATEIRETFRVQAFLYEHISDERKAEMAAVAAARERARLFANQLEKHKQQAQIQGMEFLAPDNVIRYKSVNYRDQVAVLVGGFKSEDDARKALDKVRTWPSPKDKILMDGAAILRDGPNGKQVLEQGHINPYLTASIVPNPTIARAAPAAQPQGLDPFVVMLNKDRPYNLMNATKSWTLAVKSFSAPVEIVSKDTEASVMKKFGSSKGADALKAGAEQAESMAKMLRELKDKVGNSLGLEAFVLHTRFSSIVTIGQFDGPNDPALIQLQNLLNKMKLNVTEDKMGGRAVTNTPTLFGTMMPIPVPRPANP